MYIASLAGAGSKVPTIIGAVVGGVGGGCGAAGSCCSAACCTACAAAAAFCHNVCAAAAGPGSGRRKAAAAPQRLSAAAGRLGARELQHSPSSPARRWRAPAASMQSSPLLLTDRLLHPPLTTPPPNFTPPCQPLQAHASSRASPRRSRCSGASGGGVRTRSLQRSSRASGEAQGLGRVRVWGGY